MRIVTIKNGLPKAYKHKFGIIYTGFSRIEMKDNLRITPVNYPHELWDKIHGYERPQDPLDFGCKTMEKYKAEARRLDGKERKSMESTLNVLKEGDWLFYEYYDETEHVHKNPIRHKRRPMKDKAMEAFVAAATLAGQDAVDYRTEQHTTVVDIRIGQASRQHRTRRRDQDDQKDTAPTDTPAPTRKRRKSKRLAKKAGRRD